MVHPSAIGGYLALETSGGRGAPYPVAIALESARAGFLHVLRTRHFKRVWLPWYVCGAMTRQAALAQVPLMRYGLAEDWGISERVELAPDDCLVYVNYFGLCDAQVDAVLRRFDPRQVIIDHAQALFSPPRTCLANLYSPRKFVGAPDGGYLVASGMEAPQAATSGDDSIRRVVPLLMRLNDQVEAGYAMYVECEAGFDRAAPLAMSRVTQALLSSIDYDSVALRRRQNFVILQEALGTIHRCPLEFGPKAVPLAYPLIGAPAILRQHLIDQRVFVPRYWPEILEDGGSVPEFERFLAQECLPLPCNQQCSTDDMRRVAMLVRASHAR
jgi:hypothetical protein